MAYQAWKVEIAFASQPDALVQVRVDVTADIDGQIEIIAGETANSQDPGNRCSFNLRNIDQRYTPGNPLSATALKAGRKVFVTETIADQVIEIFTGYLQFPTLEQWVESNATEPREQTITVTAVDQIARLDRGRPFAAALTEYVIYNGASDLKGFWPMTEEAEPFGGVGPVATALDIRRSSSGTTGLRGEVQCQTGLAPDGLESSGARMVSHPEGPGHAFIETYLPSTFAPAVGANDAIVVIFWWAFPPSMASNDAAYRKIAAFNGPTAGLALEMSSSSRQWVLTASGLTGSINGGYVGDQQCLPVGMYLNESTKTMELWTGSVRLGSTGNLTGAPVGAGTFLWGGMGYQCDYDISAIQIYVGQNYGYAQYLAQIQQAWVPLDQQLTGSRINTLLDYAGYPRGDAFRAIDPGVAIMGPATLANLSPKDAIDIPVATEQGRFYVSGRGQTVFADRTRMYDI